MNYFNVWVMTLTLSASIITGCAQPQHCSALVEKLCRAAGQDACEVIETNPPTDEAACAATLEDPRALNGQLDALMAAAAAKALTPAPVDPSQKQP